MSQVSVLFVCLGNICRSPTAEGIIQGIVNDAGLSDKIGIDSAGTSDWHAGYSPDPRSQKAALSRGCDISHLRGRQVETGDFAAFDYILPMDQQNFIDLEALRPADFNGELKLFLDYSEQSHFREVPDPYSLGADAFERVLDLVEDASRGLLAEIRSRYRL